MKMIKYILKKLYNENEKDIDCILRILLFIALLVINAHAIFYLINFFSETPEESILPSYLLGFFAIFIEDKLFNLVLHIIELKDRYEIEQKMEEYRKIKQKKEDYNND